MDHKYEPPKSGCGNVVERPPDLHGEDRGIWMQGFLGEKFWPFDPRVEDINIETVAHSLAQQCRFGGHTKWHYSVGQHTLLASHFHGELFPLEKLMHDASEAYLQDVPRPIKRQFGMEKYREVEDRWHTVLANKYGFKYPFPEEVHLTDEVMLHTEARALMAHGAWHDIIDWKFLEQFGDELPAIVPMDIDEVKAAWLRRFHELTDGRWQ